MSDGTTAGPEPYAVALVRGGPRAAVTVAVVALYLRGAVGAGRTGTLRRIAAPPAEGDAPPFRHPLEKAVRVGLYRPAGIRELLERAVVRRALTRMRKELETAGRLRRLVPGATRAARRHLAALQARHPLPDGPEGLAEEDVLLAVALHGDRALTALVPVLARDGGLVGRGGPADEGLFPAGRGFVRGIIGVEGYDADGDEDEDDRGLGGGPGDHGHDHGHTYGHDHGWGGGHGCGGGGGGGD
ncbi:hypothetical protein GCM10010129_26810 [Streptomyces fumigatiscleroticus]|nr:hypothetical protein GCM10010129_26810 [Streptomyces fumigatiscleroticus]